VALSCRCARIQKMSDGCNKLSRSERLLHHDAVGHT
jgi:hypothetical protein